MKIPFIKIDNAGNSYVYIRKESLVRSKIGSGALARRISDRNKGIGSDGLIVVEIKEPGTARITVFNRDGSEAKLCGNGLRGTVLFMRETSKSRNRRFEIATRWRDYDLDLIRSGQEWIESGLRLGQPSFAAVDIGYTGEGKSCMGLEFTWSQGKSSLYCVAMPNPHAVIFVDNFHFDWQKGGMEIEKSPLFKGGINVMFCRVDSRKKISVYPWERGSGATLSCGSGAAAAAVAAGMLGYIDKKAIVVMPGGSLNTSWDIGENEVYQSGPSRIVCTGFYWS